MSTAIVMTDEEKERLLEEQGKALLRGDYAASDAIALKLPIPGALVPWVKEYFTEEEIQEMKLIMP